jgi:hypothetical protein
MFEIISRRILVSFRNLARRLLSYMLIDIVRVWVDRGLGYEARSPKQMLDGIHTCNSLGTFSLVELLLHFGKVFENILITPHKDVFHSFISQLLDTLQARHRHSRSGRAVTIIFIRVLD